MREYDDMIANLGIKPYTEAYYGSMPELKRMDALFDEVLRKARSEGMNRCNPNKYPEIKEICSIFNKVFGFKKTYFYWYPERKANAFTATDFAWIIKGDTSKFITKRADKGFYDFSGKSILTVYGYTGILDEKRDITGRELTAIFLHEIGHNFDMSPYHKFDSMIKAIFTLGYTAFRDSKNRKIEDLNDAKLDYMKPIKDKGDAIYKDQKRRDEMDAKVEKQLTASANTNFFKEFITFILLANSRVLSFYVEFSLMWMTMPGAISGRKGELFSDSFAAAYGYGSELISGLNKIMDQDAYRTKELSGATLFFRDLNQAILDTFLELIDPHGSNAERCHEVIEKLEWDLEHSDFPPELEDELRKEIENVKEVQYKMLHATEDERYFFSKFWRRFVEKFLGGSFSLYKLFPRHKV